MSNFIGLLVMSLLSVWFEPVWGITVRKFVYQKDMSEHCRRRVVPSVFLGRHVMEAHSQILHFSRMELPYSCFISIRAESGSNIVLVVQLLSEESLSKGCSDSSSQLLVYDMGETFGGYWGPLPDTIIKQKPVQLGPYTILPNTPETTRSTVSRLSKEEISEWAPETTSRTESAPIREQEQQDFIRVEVPLVEVSGKLVPGLSELTQVKPAFDSEESFDILYDVTPRPRVQYQSSIIPLVQFAMRQQDGRRGEEPRFDLAYELPVYTPDARITLPLHAIKTTKRWRDYKINYSSRRRNLKNIRTFHRQTKMSSSNLSTKENIEITANISSTTAELKSRDPVSGNWENIEKLMKTLKNSIPDHHADQYQNRTDNTSNLLKIISNIKHNNESVYLQPDWASMVDLHSKNNYLNFTQRFSSFTRKPFTLFTYGSRNIPQFLKHTSTPTVLVSNTETQATGFTIKQDLDVDVSIITKRYKENGNIFATNTSMTTTMKSEKAITFITNLTTTVAPKLTTVFDQNDSGFSSKIAETLVTKNNVILTAASSLIIKPKATTSPGFVSQSTGSLVDHESWENVVQAAPVMALLLNQTDNSSAANTPLLSSSENSHVEYNRHIDKTASSYKDVRKKRTIQPIPIENARPHNLTTRELPPAPVAVPLEISQMQDFAKLVELSDDELHERVALRYLRQYVGPSLFNICDAGEPKSRHVYLFNSSRVVIAINNFTLERMTVMLTPAHTLYSSSSRCSADSLECQVYGTRICIDTMNACDGVPNCGVYDIYDEDRLMCGAAVGLLHNVFLAALTFLAVLLTVMYTVHYWLRRCVPRVSEAFFIYTDGSENKLHLKTIMRSPHEPADKMGYDINIFPDDFFDPGMLLTSRQNIFMRIVKVFLKCCKCMRRKKRQLDEYELEDDNYTRNFNEPKKKFSFAELELSNIMHHTQASDAAVQTGDSLEMANFRATKRSNFIQPEHGPGQGRTKGERTSFDDDGQRHVDELSILKFFKDVKSEPGPSTSRREVVRERKLIQTDNNEEEEELQVQFYDPHLLEESPEDMPQRITTSCEVHPEIHERSKQVKRLRFDEEAIAIPCDYDEDDDDAEQLSYIALSDGKNNESSKTGEGHPSSSAGRDFKSFWKSKKSKKKTHRSSRS